MATAKNTAPAVKLVPLPDDEYDSIRATGGPGRQAKPSIHLAEVHEALKAMPKGGWKEDKDGWFVVRGTQANTIEVHSREFRKAAKQINVSLADADKIKVELRPRKDHPKLGDFVAWRVSPAPVVADTPSGEESAE